MGSAKGLFDWVNAGIVRIEAKPNNRKNVKIKKAKIKLGNLPENVAKRDKMAEMAKFRKAEKTRAGKLFKTWGQRKGSSKGSMRELAGSNRNPKFEKWAKLKSEK